MTDSLADLVLGLAFFVGFFAAPLCLAVGVVGVAESRVPPRWRLALATTTAFGLIAYLVFASLWSAGFATVDTAAEAPPSATEDAAMVASAVLNGGVALAAACCLARARGWTPRRQRREMR